jgi:N6-adenosine-specific RNA methylase IME4
VVAPYYSSSLDKEMVMKKYDILYVDPAWDYKGQTQQGNNGSSGGAITHYDTHTVAEMRKWSIDELCEVDCLMFMWTSSPHMDQAIRLGEVWGFDYKTVAFVWDKQRVNPGYYTMSQVELCLVFKKKGGKIPRPRGARNVRQFLSEERRKHSVKPDTIRDRIVEMFPTQSKIELFARENHSGWDNIGKQVPGASKTIR